MSKKFTEEELDAKFEEFMQKLSTDEETSRTLSITKEDKKEEAKDTLWWLRNEEADDKKPGASKPSLVSWLKSTSKTISSEKTSNVGVTQPQESTPVDDRSEISEHNSTLATESSIKNTNSQIRDSKTSQILTGGGDYSEDFESGHLDILTSDKRTETHGDANEQLSTLDDITLNSGGSDAESSSASEQPSRQDTDSDKTSDHRLVTIKKPDSSESEIPKHLTTEAELIPLAKSSGDTIEPSGEETSKTQFGQETFVIKSNQPRSVEEILKEAEEIERHNTPSVSSESSLVALRQVDQVDIENLSSTKKRLEPKRSTVLKTDTNFHVPNVDNLDLQQLLKEERRRYAKLQAEVSAQENDSKQRLENQRVLYEEKLLHLEAENVHLLAKIDETRQKNAKDAKKSEVDDDDGLVVGKTDKLRKEFKEQEQLIVGYQRENEQLYDQLKNLKSELKRNRAEHDEESRKLLSELAIVRRNSQRDVGAREKTFSNSVRDEMQLEINRLLREVEFLKVENTNLTLELSSAKTARDNVDPGPGGGTSEVAGLKTRIVALENEIRKKNLEQSSAATVLSAKENRIQSLEKQVKQLEQLVSVRNPNSISALVLAAGATEDDSRQHRTVQFLEDRVRELEEKFSPHVVDESGSLKAIQDQYERLKEHYEARIAHLEVQKGVAKSATTRPQSSVTALEKELDSIRERHRKETEKMKNEIVALRQEIKHKTAINRSDDHVLTNKLRSMVSELASKDKQIKILQQKLDEAKFSVPPSPAKPNLSQPKKPGKADESELKEENRTLKSKVLQLAKQVESLQETLQGTRQKFKDVLTEKTLIKKLEDEIAAKRTELGESNARLRRANEDLSEIKCRNEIQELVTTKLRERLTIVQADSEHIRRLRTENAELRLQCHQFRERLVMAEAAYPPEWKHYAVLQARVQEVEKRYKDKSDELMAMADQYRKNLAKTQPEELQAEVDRWKAVVEQRNGEIVVFRDKMNEIIAALESLYAEVHDKRKAR